jgi:hypothetical protein
MQPETRPQVALPKDFRLEQDGQRTTVSWRWFKWNSLILVVFSALFTGYLVLEHSRLHIFELLTHIPMTGFLIYVTLMSMLNTSRLEVSGGELRIQHGPFPFWNITRDRTVSGREISQLYGQEMRGSKGKITYSLFALDSEGRKHELAFWLEDKNQVLYLEQTLERLLGLEDKPVEGEAAPRGKVA